MAAVSNPIEDRSLERDTIILNPEVHEAQFSYSLERTRIFAKFINCGAVQRNDEFSLLFKRMFGQLPDLG